MKKIALITVLLLTGCQVETLLHPSTTTKVITTPFDKHGNRLCPMYKKPKLIKAPSFPLDALKKLKEDDHKTMDMILANHIRKLQKVNEDNLKLIEVSYKEYTEKCRQTDKYLNE